MKIKDPTQILVSVMIIDYSDERNSLSFTDNDLTRKEIQSLAALIHRHKKLRKKKSGNA